MSPSFLSRTSKRTQPPWPTRLNFEVRLVPQPHPRQRKLHAEGAWRAAPCSRFGFHALPVAPTATSPPLGNLPAYPERRATAPRCGCDLATANTAALNKAHRKLNDARSRTSGTTMRSRTTCDDRHQTGSTSPVNSTGRYFQREQYIFVSPREVISLRVFIDQGVAEPLW